jgi:tRNA threonylcarbamoyladenosine biosynthesis protein TsaE
VITRSAEETRALGRTIGDALGPGDLVLVSGDLGVGKTVFIQGIAEALGVTDPVTSPTFTLMHIYRGRVPLVHVDVYRLERTGELADLALDELADDAVVTVEWGDAVAAALPPERLEVQIGFGNRDDDREIEVHRVEP